VLIGNYHACDAFTPVNTLTLSASQISNAASPTSPSFTTANLIKSQIRSSLSDLRSSNTKEDTDAAFSAFADSLDEEELFGDQNPSTFGDDDNNAAPTWQESLESLLDPMTPQVKRQILLSDLVNANENIRNDVQAALRERRIDPLLSPTGKKIQDGTKAVARQLTTDILPGIAAAASATNNGSRPSIISEELPTLVPKIGSRIFDAFSNQARKQIETLQGDLADPRRIPERISKQTADLAAEARNVFLETPEGLAGPQYTVVSAGRGYEIRDYEGYYVASSSMSKVGESYSMDDLTKGGAAFNALAAYLFGANDEGRIMDMTTPVTTTSLGEMRFYLKEGTTSLFPEPLSREDGYNEQGIVKIVEVPQARLAVARFTGFVTEGEVLRQKDTLLSSLVMDSDYEVDVSHGAVVPHVIFQYNPPYTIPMVRRNEIAVPVRYADELSDLQSEWMGEGSGSEGEQVAQTETDAPSDVE